MNTGLALAALALGGVSLTLFVLSLRRHLNRQSDVVVSMLQRYDDRLATFAQSLNDALTSLPAHATPSLDLGDDSEPVLRTLELAVARTAADGAVALVTGDSGAPVVATIGLSEAETHHIASMGFPDYRGARAIDVAFSGDIDAPDGSPAIRAGLVLPLLGDDQPQSLLSVLTRDAKRRFSEDDVASAHRDRDANPPGDHAGPEPQGARRGSRARPADEPLRQAVLRGDTRARDLPRARIRSDRSSCCSSTSIG